VNLRKALYEASEGKCFFTGKFVALDEVSVDHLYPLSMGGRNCIANYVLTDNITNIKKSDAVEHTLVERMQYLNIILYAPRVLALYQKYSQKVLPSSDWLTLDCFLKDKKLILDSGSKNNLRGFLKSKADYRIERPVGKRGKHAVFNVLHLEKIYAEFPSRFIA